MVNIGSYDLCVCVCLSLSLSLSPRVTKGWRQKEINQFVWETKESACIIIIIVEIIMAIHPHVQSDPISFRLSIK